MLSPPRPPVRLLPGRVPTLPPSPHGQPHPEVFLWLFGCFAADFSYAVLKINALML